MTDSITSTATTFEHRRQTNLTVAKLAVAGLAIVWFLTLLTVLPGGELLPWELTVNVRAMAVAILAIVLGASAIHLASDVAAAVHQKIGGPDAVMTHITALIHWHVVLAGVLIVHRGVTPFIAELASGGIWIVELLFLLVAVIPLVFIGARLVALVNPAADELATYSRRLTP